MRLALGDWLIVAVIALLCLAAVVPLFPTTVGDGYIVARYAENLVNHGELSFNLGERIWAFTSVTHIFIEAGLYALTGHTLVGNKVASLIVVGVGAALIASLAHNRTERTLALLGLAACPFILYWAIHGLETAYLFALVAVLVWQVRRPLTDGPWPMLALGLTAGLMVLTRYDAVLIAGPVVAHALLRRRRPLSDGLALLPGGALVLTWVVFAWLYYGDLVPASFHHKRPGVDLQVLGTTAVYVSTFVVFSGALAVSYLPWGPRTLRDHSITLLRDHGGLALGIVLMLLYGLLAATKHMMFGYRLLLPLLPALWALALHIRHTAGLPERPTPLWRALLPIVLVGGMQGALYWTLWNVAIDPSPVQTEYSTRSIRDMNRAFSQIYEPMAPVIQAHWEAHPLDDDETPRLFTFEAGLVPYRLPFMHTIDQGLVTPHQVCDVDGKGVSHYFIVRDRPGQDRITLTRQRYPGAELLDTFGDRDVTGYAVHLFYRADPDPYVLPSRIYEPCKTQR